MDALFQLSYLPRNREDEYHKKCGMFCDYVVDYLVCLYFVNVVLAYLY